jgi:thiol-disulfide isomerase/thioredoxin
MAENTKPPRKKFALAMIVGAALLGLAGFVYVVLADASKPGAKNLAQFATGSLGKLEVKNPAPAQSQMQFVDGAGGKHNLAEWRGKVLVVNFWATWCAPCVKEMPTLGALARAEAGPDFAVVAIDFDREDQHQFAVDELHRLSGGLDFYADPSFSLAFDAGAAGFPTTIIYDRQGKEIARVAGEADWMSKEARALIAAARASFRKGRG